MKHRCNCCDSILTDEQIERACEDASTPEEELVFCCSGYTWEGGCSENDPNQPAYWRTA